MDLGKLHKLFNVLLHSDNVLLDGPMFSVREKEHFNSPGGVKGYIIRYREQLLKYSSSHTHFTPNMYRFAGYTNNYKTHIKGFEELNLKRIHTFVIDIDTHIHSVQTILLTCMDESIGVPTFIVKSPRGFQLYFVLDEPHYISNKQNFLSLVYVKRISRNLKRSLSAIDADPLCNDFGFFRLPNVDNVVFTNLEQTYSLEHLIDWSKTFDDGEDLFHKQSNTTTAASPYYLQCIHALLNMDDVKGSKGQIGRNNALFTLALVCYQSKLSISTAQDYMEQLNTRFSQPLADREVYKILSSAYSGKYNGATNDYLNMLLELYAPHIKITTATSSTGWYKFKKPREERTRSHFHEWESDITEYIEGQAQVGSPFIWKTQKELCEILKIPQSSLNALLKRSTTILKVSKGRGRSAITGWSTRALFIKHLIMYMKNKQKQYQTYLIRVLKNSSIEHNPCYALVVQDMQQINKKYPYYDSA